jgi:hypothetical protein
MTKVFDWLLKLKLLDVFVVVYVAVLGG